MTTGNVIQHFQKENIKLSLLSQHLLAEALFRFIVKKSWDGEIHCHHLAALVHLPVLKSDPLSLHYWDSRCAQV